jgi:hypothetical protein
MALHKRCVHYVTGLVFYQWLLKMRDEHTANGSLLPDWILQLRA